MDRIFELLFLFIFLHNGAAMQRMSQPAENTLKFEALHVSDFTASKKYLINIFEEIYAYRFEGHELLWNPRDALKEADVYWICFHKVQKNFADRTFLDLPEFDMERAKQTWPHAYNDIQKILPPTRNKIRTTSLSFKVKLSRSEDFTKMEEIAKTIFANTEQLESYKRKKKLNPKQKRRKEQLCGEIENLKANFEESCPFVALKESIKMAELDKFFEDRSKIKEISPHVEYNFKRLQDRDNPRTMEYVFTVHHPLNEDDIHGFAAEFKKIQERIDAQIKTIVELEKIEYRLWTLGTSSQNVVELKVTGPELYAVKDEFLNLVLEQIIECEHFIWFDFGEDKDVAIVLFGETNIIKYYTDVICAIRYNIMKHVDTEKGCICCVCYEKPELLLEVHNIKDVSVSLYHEVKLNLKYRAHVVCTKCFDDWFNVKNKSECPACRQKVERKQIDKMNRLNQFEL